MKKFYLFTLVFFLISVFLSGCSKLSKEEVAQTINCLLNQVKIVDRIESSTYKKWFVKCGEKSYACQKGSVDAPELLKCYDIDEYFNPQEE